MVRRISDDTDAHCPHHPHQPDSVHPIAGELATDTDDVFHHGDRSVFAIFTTGQILGIRSVAAIVLAPGVGDFDLLRRPDATHQDVARPQKLDLTPAYGERRQTNTKATRGHCFPDRGYWTFPSEYCGQPVDVQQRSRSRLDVFCRRACIDSLRSIVGKEENLNRYL